jgi:hydrophobic/amphiphilic exporter-1 (mainly G- bacteria), HAE1 family
MFRSTEINGSPAPGVSSGEAMAEMERIARATLPQGMGFEWSGIAKEQIESGNTTMLIFGLALLLVLLVLAAQYESFSLPFIVLLAVPLGLAGALLGQLLRHHTLMLGDRFFVPALYVMVEGLRERIVGKRAALHEEGDAVRV